MPSTVKKNSHNRRFKPLKALIVILLVVVVASGALLVLEKTGTTDFIKEQTPANASGPSKEQQAEQAQGDAKTKQDYLDSVTKSTDSNGGDDTSTTNTETATEPSSLSISASQNGNTATILTQIHGVAAGSCKLTATNGSYSTTQTAQIIFQPEFSSCAGFSIPVNTLGTGSWNIVVAVTPHSGDALSKSTTLEAK